MNDMQVTCLVAAVVSVGADGWAAHIYALLAFAGLLWDSRDRRRRGQ